MITPPAQAQRARPPVSEQRTPRVVAMNRTPQRLLIAITAALLLLAAIPRTAWSASALAGPAVPGATEWTNEGLSRPE